MSETPIPTTDGAVRGCGGMVVIAHGASGPTTSTRGWK